MKTPMLRFSIAVSLCVTVFFISFPSYARLRKVPNAEQIKQTLQTVTREEEDLLLLRQ